MEPTFRSPAVKELVVKFTVTWMRVVWSRSSQFPRDCSVSTIPCSDRLCGLEQALSSQKSEARLCKLGYIMGHDKSFTVGEIKLKACFGETTWQLYPRMKVSVFGVVVAIPVPLYPCHWSRFENILVYFSFASFYVCILLSLLFPIWLLHVKGIWLCQVALDNFLSTRSFFHSGRGNKSLLVSIIVLVVYKKKRENMHIACHVGQQHECVILGCIECVDSALCWVWNADN